VRRRAKNEIDRSNSIDSIDRSHEIVVDVVVKTNDSRECKKKCIGIN